MIYIHVPFCKSRCLYCDFFSTTSASKQRQWAEALCCEMQQRHDELIRARVNTIYIGGGTPSQLDSEVLTNIFSSLAHELGVDATFPDTNEITIEVNPDDVTDEFVHTLGKTPVNRISMGVQTLDDKLLKLLNRRHTAHQTYEALQRLRKAGYSNISLDLMYGLPGQTMDMWCSDVDTLIEWGIEHLSAYSLQWEEGTALWQMLESGRLNEADEELSLQMYEYLIDKTTAPVAQGGGGMEHYEISNFARPGFRSRHNSGYWRDEPYVGLGPGAHSYDGNRVRKSNPANLDEYCKSCGKVTPEVEILTDGELYDELVMKSLRTSQGIVLDKVPEEYLQHLLRMSEPHINGQRLQKADGCLRLTRKGIFTSNDIMSDLML